MVSASKARLRARGLLGHALTAAGLGLGWLLLSGPAASALSDPLGAEGLLGAPLSSVSSLASPLVDPGVESAPSTLVGGTTTTLAQTVETLPTLTDPLLTGPLEPLAPVVSGATSDVGGAITTVGDTVGTLETAVTDTVGEVVSGPLPLPAPPALPDPLPTPDPVAPPAPETAPAEGPSPTGESPASQASDGLAPEGGSPADLGSTVDPVIPVGAMLAGWSLSAYAAAPPAELGPSAEHPMDGAPGSPWAFPLLDRQPWLGSGTGGSSGGGLTSAAMLSAALMLPALLLLTVRKRPYAGQVPASPAFDPGSTPD